MPKNSGPRTLLKQIDLRSALKQSMFTGKMYIYIIQQYTVVHHLLCNTNQTVFSKGKVSRDFASPFVWKVVSIAWIYSDSQMSMIVRSLQYFFLSDYLFKSNQDHYTKLTRLCGVLL